MTKPCVIPGCGQARKVNRKGKLLTMCAAHNQESWARRKSGNWEGWLGSRHGRTTCKVDGCPEPRLITKGGHKQSYCKKHQSELWRGGKEQRVSIINPLTNTVRHAQLILLDEPKTIQGSYALFVLGEKERGALVVVEG